MEFEWDENKRLENVRKHGVDFMDAALIFENDYLEAEDRSENYGEIRMQALGHVDGQYYMVIYTPRKMVTRIISAWKVSKSEKRRYQEVLSERA